MCVDQKTFSEFREEMRLGIQDLRFNTEATNRHLEKQNGRIRKVERLAGHLRSSNQQKETNCPYRLTIKSLADNAMTVAAVKDYIEKKEARNNRKLRAIIAGAALFVPAATYILSLLI